MSATEWQEAYRLADLLLAEQGEVRGAYSDEYVTRRGRLAELMYRTREAVVGESRCLEWTGFNILCGSTNEVRYVDGNPMCAKHRNGV